MEHRRPEIHVCYSRQNKEYVKDILAGIEEEGLFGYSYEIKDYDPITSAYKASESSLLGVGISITKKQAVLHVTNLEIDIPLLNINIEDNTNLREFGNNAARYVKGKPLKI
jgi:hypothetical protein